MVFDFFSYHFGVRVEKVYRATYITCICFVYFVVTACLFKYDSFRSYLTTSGIVSVAFFALVMIITILLPIQDLALTQLIIAGVLVSICYLIGPLYGFGLEIMVELKADVFCLFVTIVDNLLIFKFPTLVQEKRTELVILQNFILKKVKERRLTKLGLGKIIAMENEGIGIRSISNTLFIAQNEIIVGIGTTPIFSVNDFDAVIKLLPYEEYETRVWVLR